MLFNSHEFILVYLPLVLVGFYLLARLGRVYAAGWLALASFFFYGWWSPKFVGLLFASIVFNYAAGMAICRTASRGRRKVLLVAGIVANLSLLGFFKYWNFFVGTTNALAGASFPLLDLVLPIGISFFTFTQIAFLVDAYRGLAREYNPVHYALFVTYFPHLVAGPVLHHKQMMPQFEESQTYRFSSENLAVGLTAFTIGLAKKVLLADSFAEYASPVFGASQAGDAPRLAEAWTGALAYTFQLYFDFSGYSDMALGLSRMFGVRLPANFSSPYKATNIIDFWRRWHMTLSQFLRDYLYIPLGGNHRGPARRYLNLMVTMLLGGLWHGASWTFVAWGGLHGFYLIVNHGWHALRRRFHGDPTGEGSRFGRLVATGTTFLAVVVGWVFFRAESFTAALTMLEGMAGMNGVSLPASLEPALTRLFPKASAPGIGFNGVFPSTGALANSNPDLFLLLTVLGGAIVWLLPNTQQWLGRFELAWGERAIYGGRFPHWVPHPALGAALGVMLGLMIMNLTKVSEFLYFQF